MNSVAIPSAMRFTRKRAIYPFTIPQTSLVMELPPAEAGGSPQCLGVNES
jgi:hypothetical protein